MELTDEQRLIRETVRYGREATVLPATTEAGPTTQCLRQRIRQGE
jgi:hypothetical protein